MKWYVIGVEDEHYDRLVEEASGVVGWAHKNLGGDKDWFSGTTEWCVDRLSKRLASVPSQGYDK